MGETDSAFLIETQRSWPVETYKISTSSQLIDPRVADQPAENIFRYVNNPLNETNSINPVLYQNFRYTFSDDIGQYIINIDKGASFTWDLSSSRMSYNLGPQFNYFYVNNNPGNPAKYRNIYSYLLYPSRLFLKPLSLTKGASSWILSTSAVVSNPTSFFFNSTNAESLSFEKHKQFLNTGPSFYQLPSDSSISLVFDLSATRTRIDIPFITFDTSYNPRTKADTLEKNYPSVIRPDSTFISYEVNYMDAQGKIARLGQNPPDIVIGGTHGFKSSFILDQSKIGNNIQTYQLLQFKPAGGEGVLNDSKFCVLSAVWNLSAASLSYYNKNDYYGKTLTNFVTGVPGTNIGARFCSDSGYLFSSETVNSTLSTFQINGTSVALGSAIASNNCYNQIIKWCTKYPPHYYSYKTSLLAPNLGFNKLSDTCNLNFDIHTATLNSTTTSVTLSTYIASDFNLLSYDLVNNSINEVVKFEVVGDRQFLSLNSVFAYYGSNLDQVYDLISSPWIPAASATKLFLTYPHATYGEIDLSLRPTLSSAAGFISGKNATLIKLAEGITQDSGGSPIFLDIVGQTIGNFTVTCNMLTASPGWPSKDLRGSNIKWSYTPTDLNLSFYSIDSLGNVLSSFRNNQVVPFSEKSSTVQLSGYGLNSVTITLSSQKYRQTTNVSSNTGLYDAFDERTFNIYAVAPINNFERTRYLQVAAKIPFGGQTYPIPEGTPLYWLWKYDHITDPLVTPISVSYLSAGKLTPYEYGTTLDQSSLSSIYVQVVPEYSNSIPAIHSVKLSLVSDVRSPRFWTDYEFFVDEFPSRDLLNSDFNITYTGYSETSATVLNTANDVYTLTRPNDGTNIFTLSSANTSDVALSSTYVWSISNNTGFTSSVRVQYKDHYIQYKITDPLVKTTIITLSALSAVAVGWDIPNILTNPDMDLIGIPYHSVSTSVKIFTPTVSDFYRPLEFVTYPEYAWLSGRNLTLLNTSNYTLAQSPTAYTSKKTKTQNFYLSANKSFSEYDYLIGTNSTFLSTINSRVALVEFPYTTEFFSNTGLPIRLSAFSEMYPSSYPLYFVKPASVGGSLITQTYALTACSYNFGTSGLSNNFKWNPKIVPADTDITFSFKIANKNNKMDLGWVRTLSLTQTICSSPKTNPVQPLLDLGYITYLITTPYWTRVVEISALEGTFKALDFKIGDPFEEGYITNAANTTISVKVLKADIPVSIQSTTFDDVSVLNWPTSRDLWSAHTVTTSLTSQKTQTLVAFNTGKQPEAFVSDLITLVGEEIFIEYTAPNEQEDNLISFYRTNFGENEQDYVISYKNEPVKYTYSAPGSYYITYDAIYSDGSMESGTLQYPIIVKSEWAAYNQENIRTLSEDILQLPYSLNEIEIQPNEWGDSDIFNTAITRLNDNITYLSENIQSINTDFPTLYYGWLGTSTSKKADGIRWYTRNFGDKYYQLPNQAVGSGVSYFNSLKDVIETPDAIYVLDKNRVRMFNNNHFKPSEYPFINSEDLNLEFISPTQMDTSPDGGYVYVLDPPRNKIVCLEVDLDLPALNVSINVGGFGSKEDPNKFNAPSDLCCSENHLFVLDYNNKCVKEFTQDLNWVHTYYTSNFNTNQPLYIASNFDGMAYVLCKDYTIYVFDSSKSEPIFNFSIASVIRSVVPRRSTVKKITFDEAGEFLYVLVSVPGGGSRLFKFSAAGMFIGSWATPVGFTATSIRKSHSRHLLICSAHAIIKLQDVVNLFKIGNGLPYDYWTKDQLIINKNEFATDTNYNRSLVRIAQNIKMFRNMLNAKFSKVTEKTFNGVVTYYALVPVSVQERPLFDDAVENETLGVAVNEYHIPQVLNRELRKLHESIVSLKEFLDISAISLPDFKIENSGISVLCPNGFCWSWSAMASYNLSLPTVRICNVNPITYAELRSSFPIQYESGDWTKTWDGATSDCCSNISSPL